MDDLISRQAAIDAIKELCLHYTPTKSVSHPHMDFVIEELTNLPSAQPKTCRWTNKGVFYGDDVDAWQECECSKCGRWDTRPYMYYFDEPNYCSYCGAKRQR